MNLTNVFGLVAKEKVLELLPVIDPVSSAVLEALDWERYPAGPGLGGIPWHALLGGLEEKVTRLTATAPS